MTKQINRADSHDMVLLGIVLVLPIVLTVMAGSMILVTGFMDGWHAITTSQWLSAWPAAVAWAIYVWVRLWPRYDGVKIFG